MVPHRNERGPTMADKNDEMRQETALSFDVQIVSSELSTGMWHVMLGGARQGTISIGRCGEFNVTMDDGTDTYCDEWHLDSLRKASAWAIRHLVGEEIEKRW